MMRFDHSRGGTPVGLLAELDGLEATIVRYFRLWRDGPRSQAQVWKDFASGLGRAEGQSALQSFDELCGLITRHGRRALISHRIECACLGADESCFANFIASAAEGDREDAMLIATLLVRPDMAPIVTALATDVGMALKRMQLGAARAADLRQPAPALLH
ncbi:hypothetical protein EI983_02755 [Roseovarius faecimaris]|uniref:Uncharacterized protein n=1 Tax=Roseovarius faecimaris TaxID=2494550 RepID=A0A6I6ILS2_9RHOB|nr:hypothetical protein [Roseovarius faecimaris]QGX97252.1 hypothetical protein EI983_02755 [Roseovarius faecimaris]